MLQPSKTNNFIQIFAWIIMFSTYLGAVVTAAFSEGNPFIDALIIIIYGTFTAVFLFAISEVLTRLQKIEYNTRKDEEKDEEKENKG